MAHDGQGGFTGWAVAVVEGIGESGVGLLIALESIFPPIPSEVVLPFAGFSAAHGDLSLVLAWVAATLGALSGAYLLYAVGALTGYDRARRLAGQRWFLLFDQADLERGERFFERHGWKVVLVGRCIPFLRSVVSVPAGIARMPLLRFSALTLLGSGVWNAAFLLVGYQLGDQWHRVHQWTGPVGWLVLATLVLAVAWPGAPRASPRRR